MNRIANIFQIFLLCTVTLSSNAQGNIFDKQSILEIEIIGDLKELFNDVIPQNARYHDIIIYYLDGDSSVSLPAKAMTRGIFRRNRSNCKIPSLAIKPQKINDPIFNTSQRIKLVNPCMNTLSAQQYIIKEYYAYRIYNILTDYSFKVRLVKILYLDRVGKYKNFFTYGILIEPLKWLANRTNTKEIKTQGIIQNATYRPVLDAMAMFQYLIGNTDWSVPKLHNIKLLYHDSLTSVIPVPYDFDYCGFVNPPYTKPPEIIPISSVRERYYRGNCRQRLELNFTIDFFIKKKAEIMNIITADSLLTEKNKNYILNYIDMFYSTLSDPKLVKREFIENCRNE
mgnify:CR=1 FL=1